MSLEKIQESVTSTNIAKLRDRAPSLGKSFFRNGRRGKGIASFSKEQIDTVQTQLALLLGEFGYNEMGAVLEEK